MEIIIQNCIKIVGLSVRTRNQNEMNPSTAKISKLVSQYFTEQWMSKIPYTKSRSSFESIAVYSNYESDATGFYTYYFGKEVDSFDDIPPSLSKLEIPAGKYAKFTTERGPIHQVVINAWMKIWNMSEAELGGKRRYSADYEVYGMQSQDPQNAIIDIYIALL